MDYEVTLNNGREVTKIELKNAEINTDEFIKTLNDYNIGFVNLGGMIERKANIESIRPIAVVNE